VSKSDIIIIITYVNVLSYRRSSFIGFFLELFPVSQSSNPFHCLIQHQINVGLFNLFLERISHPKLYELLLFSTVIPPCLGQVLYISATKTFSSTLNQDCILSSYNANQ